MKLFRLVVLSVLIAQVTFSSALAEETPAPEAVNTQAPEVVNTPTPEAVNASPVDVPVPDKPAADSSKVAPKVKKKKAPVVPAPRLAYPRPPHPYNMEAIEEFNTELYGEGN
ncbi:MAG TPA: hypothetical protein DDZ80_12805 [Cyanobacteria bacterium UBA8803]|nr:hypothetical protein [Cyanobacteria bacterium UBA8803]